MKTYIIEYTTDDTWELAMGVIVVVALTVAKARKIAQKLISGHRIIKTTLVKLTKEQVVFDQGPVVE